MQCFIVSTPVNSVAPLHYVPISNLCGIFHFLSGFIHIQLIGVLGGTDPEIVDVFKEITCCVSAADIFGH